jgi:hypothetical protein
MSQNRENEFENLFKRASENYPINSSNADWNAVLAGLEEEGKDKKGFFLLNKKYVLFAILLLLVALSSSVITGLIVRNSSANKKTIKVVSVNKQNIQQNTATEKKIADEVYKKVILEIQSKPIHSMPIKAQVVYSKNIKNDQKKSEYIIPPLLDTNKAGSEHSEKESVVISKIPADSTEEFKGVKPINTFTSDLTNSIQDTKNSIVKLNHPTNHFYGGVLFARDKSSIKLEPNKGTGYSLSFMLGYQFSKKWSIESGLHIEKKELYTSGSNFDKSILQASGNIVWIESEAQLLEIPITIKRNLFQKKKHSFFTTLGLSSFIVNKETVEYEEEIGGVFQNESVVFNHNTSNFFSTINLSLGYQYHLGKIGNIRIEPYFNIPIGVIGNSKSPVYSKGVFIGWTYDLKNHSSKH